MSALRSPIRSALFTAIRAVIRPFLIGGGALFNPGDLFDQTDQGVWFDLDDDMDTKIAFRRNLLLWSEDFSNAFWSPSPTEGLTRDPTGLSAPDGSLTTYKLAETATLDTHRLGVGGAPLGVKRLSVYAKQAERNFLRAWSWSGGMTSAVHFNLTTGVMSGAIAELTPTIENVGGGWWRCSVLVPAPHSSVVFGPADVDGGTATNPYQGILGNGIYVWGAQCEFGATASSYQKVTDWNTEFMMQYPAHALFTDNFANIPVTNIEQPLGFVIDKHLGAVLGTDLVDTANTPPAWVLSGNTTVVTEGSALKFTSSDGTGTATLTLGAAGGLSTNLIVGNWYQLRMMAKVNPGGQVQIRCLSDVIPSRNVTWSEYAMVNMMFRASVVAPAVDLIGLSASETLWIEGITVKEIAGNHRTQATAGNRPVWTARKNQLTTTETFDDNSWILLGATRTAILGPSGAMDAVRISMAGDGDGFRSNAASFPQASFATISMWLRAPTPGLTTVQTNGGVQLPTTVVPVTTEWVKHTFTTLGGAGDNQFWFCRRTAGSTAPEVEIWNPQVEFNTVATPYQRVNTNTDYDAIGFPKGARYNGVNNSMITAPVDFTANGVMTASYGVAHLARSGFGMICAFNTTGIGQVGTFYDTFMVGGNLEISSTATTTLHGTTSPVTLAVPIVLSTLRDNLEVSRETQIVTRVNATQQTLLFAQPTPLVASNWGTHLLWFGENNSLNRLNGIEYNTTLINKILTVEQLDNLEQFNATKSGVTLP